MVATFKKAKTLYFPYYFLYKFCGILLKSRVGKKSDFFDFHQITQKNQKNQDFFAQKIIIFAQKNQKFYSIKSGFFNENPLFPS